VNLLWPSVACRRRRVANSRANAAPAATGSEAGSGLEPARPKVGMLVYPEMILLDLVGPQTVLSIAMTEIYLIGRTHDPVMTDVGVPITPTAQQTSTSYSCRVAWVAPSN
jgi:hypothetical protein